ncbi:Hypothetical_protein [Hexamita inflata]|uniref:Hypothetical_protein n=1 Tax=Hexamita inflata TaxID=28002 RepID=A0AA86QP02_9EUKA|nr:Hypothetical protein HINF_LOCUS47877 [Hexamita inflata]
MNKIQFLECKVINQQTSVKYVFKGDISSSIPPILRTFCYRILTQSVNRLFQSRAVMAVKLVQLRQKLQCSAVFYRQMKKESKLYSGGPSKCFFELGRRMKFII